MKGKTDVEVEIANYMPIKVQNDIEFFGDLVLTYQILWNCVHCTQSGGKQTCISTDFFQK